MHSIRLARLRELIDLEYNGKANRFADAVNRQPDYISRMLSGDKRFGEKLARAFEDELQLTRLYFDREKPLSRQEADDAAFGSSQTKELKQFADIYRDLDEDTRQIFRGVVNAFATSEETIRKVRSTSKRRQGVKRRGKDLENAPQGEAEK